MKERPIIFSTEMVKAILEGRKTQTRRIINPQPVPYHDNSLKYKNKIIWQNGDLFEDVCPYGKKGDTLWVRETFSKNHSIHYSHKSSNNTTGLIYKASWLSNVDYYNRPFEGERKWCPSIFMPRWASRIDLQITEIKIEQLKNITEEDAIKEGIIPTVKLTKNKDDYTGYYATELFEDEWNKINSKRGYPFESNPRVWVIEFKRNI